MKISSVYGSRDNIASSYTVEDATILKGFAIIIMILHHLHIEPERMNSQMRIISTINLGGVETLSHYIGRFGSICIPLFLFLSGFGLMKKFSRAEGVNLTSGLLRRLKKLYFAYWKVFAVVVPISFLIFSKQASTDNPYYYSRFYQFDIGSTIGAFLGLTPEKICGEWWFLRIYLSSLLLFPLFRMIIQRNPFWKSFWMIVVTEVFLTSVYNTLPTIPIFEGLADDYIYNNLFYDRQASFAEFLMGMLMGWNSNLEKLEKGTSEIGLTGAVLPLLAIVACAFTWNYVGGESGIIVVPILIICFRKLAYSSKVIRKIALAYGKHSTTMWLTHTFVLYYWSAFQKMVLLPRYSLLVSVWALVFVWTIAFILDKTFEMISSVINRILWKEAK